MLVNKIYFMGAYKKKAFSLIELSIVLLIIGVILTGITQGSRLVAAFRLSNARTMTQSSPVASIKDLVGWWDSSAKTGFLDAEQDDGQAVSIWRDLNPQSSDKNDLIQSDNSLRPVFTLAAINNLPALLFDGEDDVIETSAYTNSLNPEEFTIFAVVKLTNFDLTYYGAIISSRDTDASSYIYGYMLYANLNMGSPRYVLWNGNSSSSYIQNQSIATEIGQEVVLTAYYDKGADSTYLYKNSGSASVKTSSGYLKSSVNPVRVGGGANESSEANHMFGGYVGEIIIYARALKSEERTAVEQYLAKKWNIS